MTCPPKNQLTDSNNIPINNNNLNILINNGNIDINTNFDFNKIREYNNKSVDYIFDDKIEVALELLKKIELFLETNAIEPKFNLDEKILIIIIHNLACCCQKLKDDEGCISYLEAVIYHFDSIIEKKYNIKIKEEYFLKYRNEDQKNYSLLGDFILELRFCAKFHLQMCAVLSQSNKHLDALKHAKLAALMCEDNLIKTKYLYTQIKDNNFQNINEENNNEEEFIDYTEKIKQNFKIILELFNRIIYLRNKNFEKKSPILNNSNPTEKKLEINNIQIKNKLNITTEKNNTNNNHDINNLPNESNPHNFTSYLNYTTFEINKYLSNNLLTNNIRHIFGNTIKKDDWIQLLNIGNIMYLSPLNYEDLELDSDPKYELLRDAILEKVVMLTVSYFCIASELRFLCTDKNDNKTNGEFYLYKAVEFASFFLPVSCPIVKHYIVSYYKYYGNDMEIIPEDKVIEMKIDLIRSEIEQDKDTLTFVRTKKINYVNKVIITNNNKNNNSNKNESKNVIIQSNNLAIKSKIKDEKAPKFKLNFNNLRDSNSSIKENIKENLNTNNSDRIKIKHINKNIKNSSNNRRLGEKISKSGSKTERLKINKMHFNNNFSSKANRYISANNSHNHTNNNFYNNNSGKGSENGSMTARIGSSNKINNNNQRSNSSNKGNKTQRDFFHSKEKIFNNNIYKNIHQKNNIKGNNKNSNKPSSNININYNNNLIKSSTLIDKLLNHRIIQKKGINKPESAQTSQSLNSLVKIFHPKKKIYSNPFNGINKKFLKKK